MLTVAQSSRLGVDLSNSLTISAVGQADDVALLSNNIGSLDLLFHLTKQYCTKFNVKLSSSKTKLMIISPPNKSNIVCYNPLKVNDIQIEFVKEAEHVGVIRSVEGNLPNILQRFSSFKGALGAIVSCGLAKGHRSNPACSLRILSIYATPVLMSGLGSLVLSSYESSLVDQQYKRTLQGLLKVSVNSPSTLVHFAP